MSYPNRHNGEADNRIDRRKISPDSKRDLATKINSIEDAEIKQTFSTLFEILTGENVEEYQNGGA